MRSYTSLRHIEQCCHWHLGYGLRKTCSLLRRSDAAAIAGYYGPVSAGTFVTALGMGNSAGITYDSYIPVMLATMEKQNVLIPEHRFLQQKDTRSGLSKGGLRC